MANDDSKRYYWMKLNKDFFKQHEIVIIEAMPNGKEYLIFYLKLLAESVSHEGNLRFSDKIPYNEEMLGALTRTNIDVVRSALRIFEELHMIETLEDGTVYMTETKNMIGSETGSAVRKREYREQLKNESQKQLEGTNGGQCPQEIRDKSIENRNNDKLINTINNAGAFDNLPESEIKKKKKQLEAKGIDYEAFKNLHFLTKEPFERNELNYTDAASLTEVLNKLDEVYGKQVVIKAWLYSWSHSKGKNNRTAYIISILEKNCKNVDSQINN